MLPQLLALARVASVGFITLQCGPKQMWTIPISEARAVIVEMFKALLCQSIYCLKERRALTVL